MCALNDHSLYFARPRRDFAPFMVELLLIGGAVLVAVALGLGFSIARADPIGRGVASIFGNGDGHEWTCVAMQRPEGGCELMNPRTLIAAMREPQPLGSYVSVKNLDTGQSVIVRVVDRGPFKRDRIIDLSPAAAAAIGCDGLCPVIVVEAVV